MLNIYKKRSIIHILFLAVCLLAFIPGSFSFAADLTSISVTPADPAIRVGETQQFTATGTFSDENIQDLTPAIAISTGYWHACALLPAGSIKCWGDNGSGQLGNSTSTSSSTPVIVSGITTATAISAGALHTCALLSDGTVKCWGYNYYGQLGNGTTFSSNTPVSVSGISNAITIATGNNHTCAVLSDGTVKCWGYNYYGQLGNGTTLNSNTPVSVSGISNATAIATGAGNFHTCTILSDSTIKCWGSNSSGQLGNGSTINSSSPVPVSGISNAITVATGNSHTCAVLSDGAAMCWGSNGNGQLGNGTTTNSTTPVSVLEIFNAAAIGAGTNHTCAVLSDGTSKCWGFNWNGELGNGTLTNSNIPVLVSGISNATKIATGYNYTCALHSDNAVKCWGYNYSGQLGNGLVGYSVIPLSVDGISNATRITAGSNYTCALLTDTTVKCWGLNRNGQLGNGSTGYSPTPVSVNGISNALSIMAGVGQTCVILPDTTVQCWGSSYAVNGVSVSNVTSVAVGGSHACILLTDGTVKCWGNNTYGQLGNGSNASSNPPVPVNGISNATAVAAGTNHACAVLSDGTVKCWGLNDYGQLGDVSNTNANTPVFVSGISNATTVTAGYGHTCSLLSDATLKCWGANYWGQLGNGTQTNSNTPVSVNGISNAETVKIGVAGGYTCALLSDATIKCWGSNIYGQLGNGLKSYSATTPVSVSGITNALSVTTGNGHTCAILSDSSIICWGNNYYGELGDGTAGISSIPDQVIGIINIGWDSNNKAVAAIDADGLAIGISPGTTTIFAALDGISGSTTMTVNPPLPSAPSDFSAVAGDRQVTLSWTETIGATSYNVYMASEPGVTKENYSLLAGGMKHEGVTNPYVHTGLTNGITYYFIVTAVNDVGESKASNEVSAQPGIFISNINFVDPNLSACVNELGLTYAHEVTGLSCVNRGINNLSGIEFLTNLNTLNLSMNNASDVTPIASLSNLTIMNLSQNSITNISPLGGLNGLTHLSISGNLISDITPLGGLTNMVSLHLGNNKITDVTPLASLVGLTELMLYTNQIIDVTPLKGLINLRTLQLQQNVITTGVSNLVSLVNATLIDLQDNTTIPCNDLDSLVTALGVAVVISSNTCDSQGLPPVATRDLKAVPGYGQVTLSWREVRGATLYNLYMASEPGVTKDNYSLLAGGMKHGGVTSPYVHTGLSNGSVYHFVVTAVNDVGESVPSSEVSASLISQWTSIGPEGGSGYISQMVISPNYITDQTLFASTGGGVFKSIDGGTTWTAINTDLGSILVTSLAISPDYATDQTLFIGTYGGGIFKSINGGLSWTSVTIGLTGWVTAITFSPDYATDQTLFAGISGNGVFKSTDGGTTWTVVNTGLTNLSIQTLAISPGYGADQTLFAGIYASGVFKSIDGGTTWTAVNNGLSSWLIDSLAVSPNYVADQTLFVGIFGGKINKSTNGGATWAVANTGLNTFLEVSTLLISPGYATDQTLFAGTAGGVYKSIDSGAIWIVANTGLKGTLVLSLITSPDYVLDRTLFAGTYGGGVFKSTDGGATWSSVNTGIRVARVHSLAISPGYATDQTLFAGTEGGGGALKSPDGGATWAVVNTGLSNNYVESLAISPAYAADQTLFAGTYGGGIFKSTDKGATWTLLNTGLSNLIVYSIAISPGYAMDQTLFAGTYNWGIIKSTDGGATWTSVNTGLSSYSSVQSLSISPGYAMDQTLFAGTWGGVVYKSIDAGATWTASNTGMSNKYVESIIISPAFPEDQTLFAGTTGGGVLKSIDGGRTWVSVNTGLRSLAVESLTISPGYPCDGTLFAGTGGFSVWKYLDFEAMATCLPSIRGTITENGLGLGGVTLTLSGDASATTTTAPDGAYIFTGLVDGNYSIAPNKNGFILDPPSLSITVAGADVTGQDFSASPIWPNLIVSNPTVSPEGRAGQQVEVGWTVTNTSPVSAIGGWKDCVYLSNDNQIGGDTLLGCLDRPLDLAINEFYTRVHTVTIPLVTEGNFWIIIKTDAENVIAEAHETDNNAIAGPIHMIPFPIADIPFADANLAACVNALGFTYAHEVTTLNCSYRNISGLSGIEKFTNLQSLYLSGNAISDLSALEELINLTTLHVGENRIRGNDLLSAVINLPYATNLIGLGLWGSDISDLSLLSGLTDLTYLYLSNNHISDVSPLAGLINLTDLHLYSNNMSDVSSLSMLTNLRYLNLNNNIISDLSPLGDLTNLTYLYVGGNAIKGDNLLTAVLNLPYVMNLRGLGLSDSNITNLSLLASLTNLTNLDLGNNNISDLSPLSVLTNLQSLYLYNNNISDINPLSALTSLRGMDLGYNNISNLFPLELLINLTWLNLHDNSISDLSSLSGLSNLTSLTLNDNNISDVSPLSALTNLRYLYLSSNSISDVSSLAGLVNVSYLELAYNRITTGVSALVTLTSASGINLYGNNNIRCSDLATLTAALESGVVTSPAACAPDILVPLTAISFADTNLAACVNALGLTYAHEVTSLDCSYRNISNLSGIENLTNLRYLYLSGNKITDLGLLGGLINLTQLYIGGNIIKGDSLLSAVLNLAYATNLTGLGLWDSNISNLGLLSSLTNLTNLDLSNNNIGDLGPLSALINLRYLYLSNNDISELSPLASLSNLFGLNLNDNNISDISTLTDLTNLTRLHIGGNTLNGGSLLSAVLGLPYVTNLTELGLSNSNVTDVSLLSTLTNLHYLNLYNNNISDVGPLASLINLNRLYLGDNNIGDISSISSLASLWELNLYGNAVSDVSPLSGLTNLRYLYLSNNSISDVNSLAGLVNIGYLDLSYNRITTGVSALVALTSASGINLSGNNNIRCSDLEMLTAALGSGVVTSPAACAPDNPVIIPILPDPNLAACVNALGLTYAHEVTTLDCSYRNISSLSGIENLTNLQYLNLSENKISDLIPLGGLIKLSQLYIGGNTLKGDSLLTAVINLSYATNLTGLGLSNSAISDVSPLSGLTNLRYVSLWNNNITEGVASLITFTSANNINLYGNNNIPCSDLDTLTTALGSGVVTPPAACAPDVLVPIPEIPFADANLAACVNALGLTYAHEVTSLSCYYSNISSLSGIEYLTNLQYLYLTGNVVSDLTPLLRLGNLTALYLSGNHIIDVSPVASLNQLTALDLSSNSISDVTPLSGLANLTYLNLNYNRIGDISPLGGLTHLTGLHIGGNIIKGNSLLTAILNLPYVTNLTALGLHSSNINDLSLLSGLTHLTYLDLGNNIISDVSPLASLINLTRLYLYNNTIIDVSSLAGLLNLNYLSLSYNKITEGVAALVVLTNAWNIDLYGNNNIRCSDLAVLTAALGLGIVTSPTLCAPDVLVPISSLNFVDANFAACVNRLGLTYAHEVTWISCNLKNVSSLSGIENFINLNSLYLIDNNISDVSPLASLTHLDYLDLSGNNISDVSPLASLINLTYLSLSDNFIVDISPLSSLSGLYGLYIGGNQISDFSLLTLLPNLTYLSVSNSNITDLSFFATLTNLTDLDLSGNNISNVDPLLSLTNLRYLNLCDTGINDLTSLIRFTNLFYLGLCNNNIVDLNPLVQLTNLQGLDIGGNNISDYSPLMSLPNLSYLILADSNISDLTILESLNYLTGLGLSGNQISDLSPLVAFTNLNWVDLSNNNINDVSPLASLTNLYWLDLSSNNITTGVGTLTSFSYPFSINLTGNNNIPCTDLDILINAYDPGVVIPPDSCKQPPMSNLTISNSTIPLEAWTGQSIDVGWRVTNTGNLPTTGNWQDCVYLSHDNQVGGDTILGCLNRPIDLNANEFYDRVHTVAIPQVTGGDYWIIIKADANNTLSESNETDNQIAAGPLPVHVIPCSDLQPGGVVIPTASVKTGGAAYADWVVTNIGDGATNMPYWYDRVYLSADQTLGGGDVAMTPDFQNPMVLSAGESYSRAVQFTVPDNLNGNYYVIVKTDMNNNLAECREDNNVAVSPGTLQVQPDTSIPANLTIENVQVAPANPPGGAPITVAWRMTNTGDAPTGPFTIDHAIVLSVDNVLNPPPGDRVLVWHVASIFGNLGAGQSSALISATVNIPLDVWGNYHIVVWPDPPQKSGLDRASGSFPIHIQEPFPSDLLVDQIIMPAQGLSGQPISVSWVARNAANSRTLANAWEDTIILSRDNSLDTSEDNWQLGTFLHNGVLDFDETYTATRSVILPDEAGGSYFLFVCVDVQNQVFEGIWENNNCTIAPSSLNVDHRPPDLQVQQVTVLRNGLPVTSVLSGASLSINWGVVNNGSGSTSANAWSDNIYLSSDQTLDPSDIALSTAGHSGTLGAGGSYPAGLSVIIPLAFSSPTAHVFVCTDSANQVYESDNGNNCAASAPFEVVWGPSDLTMQTVSVLADGAPAASVASGSAVEVQWQVGNNGPGTTSASAWSDRIYISTDGILDALDPVLATVSHYGSIPAGGMYTAAQEVQIPINVTGPEVYLFVRADVDDRVYESDNGNNTIQSSPFEVFWGPPDLTVQTVSANHGTPKGEVVELTWTVKNNGGPTVAAGWADRVYLSSDRWLSNDDVELNTTAGPLSSHIGALNYDQSYMRTESIAVPPDSSGYLIVKTDAAGPQQVFESDESNNTGYTALPSLDCESDMIVTGVDAPEAAISAQLMSLSWSVTNQGGKATNTGNWRDAVYLSRDQYLDRDSDLYAGYFNRSGALGAGDSYSPPPSFEVRIPQGLTGPYYVFVVSDSSNAVCEINEANNNAYDGIAVQVELPPPTDLVVTNIIAPSASQLGENITVQWTVRNAGDNEARGIWHDAVYISPDATWDAGDEKIGEVRHTGPVASGGEYTGSLTAKLPGVVPGDYYIIVRTDIRNEVRESVDGELNNTTPSATVFTVAAWELLLDVPDSSHALSSGTEHYYRIANVPAGEDLLITLDTADGNAVTEVYVRHEAIPDRARYDYGFTIPNSADHEVVVPAAQGGTYYVLVRGVSIPVPQTAYTITASLLPFEIRTITTSTAGNLGDVTVHIEGSQLTPGTVVRLVGSGGTIIAEAIPVVTSSTEMDVTFNLAGVATGVYNVEVFSGTNTFTLTNGFTVINGVGSQLDARLIVPQQVRPGRQYTLWVEYANTGDTDMQAPLFIVSTRQDVQKTLIGSGSDAAQSRGFSLEPVQLLGISFDGPAGVLHPGARYRIPVYFKAPATGDRIDFLLESMTADGSPIDWAAVKPDVPSDVVASELWAAIWANFATKNATTAGYLKSLGEAATHLSREGERVYDVSKLVSLLMQQATGAFSLRQTLASGVDAFCSAPHLPLLFSRGAMDTLAQRFQVGPLGRSWSHNFEYRLVLPEATTANILGTGGGVRTFTKNTGGFWQGSVGDFGLLEEIGGGLFLLREKGGLIWLFDATGRLDSIEEPNGNRITLNYTGGNLTQVSHSNGCGFIFEYNASGRISRLTDQTGRVTEYLYDSGNEHLLGVVAPGNMTTRYTYLPATGSAADHAFNSIEYPDGTHRYYSYDAYGRLAEQSADGAAERVRLTYAPLGTVQVQDALGSVYELRIGDRGQLLGVTDPLANVTRLEYDKDFNLTRIIQTDGDAYWFGYDGFGNLTGRVDPLWNTTNLAYEPFLNRLTSVRDVRGNTTLHDYDTQGNLQTITYPDASAEEFRHDTVGNTTQWQNRRAQAIHYTYNDRGLPIRKEHADGSVETYTYDNRGNLLSATDALGVTTMSYDAADRMTRITYPNGRYLEYAYDTGGRRIRMADQDGFAVNYQYDAVGRLAGLTDRDNNMVIAYAYDAAGRLAREDKGNGTYTTYEYDVAGQVLHLTNYAPDNTIQSQFDYTYDSLGRRTSMSTLDGLWIYEYDATGQLTHAVLASTNMQIPNQDLTYVYDAAGNRIRTIENGVTTEYTTNNMNQYTTVGTSIYSYDIDGNLISKVDGGQTWTYTYDDDNRLVEVVTPDGTWSYEYDVLGNRVATIQNGQRTEYLLDPTGMVDVVGEYDGSGGLVAHFAHGLGLVNRSDSSEVSAYYNFDVIGHTRQLTGSTGTLVNTYEYSPYGNPLQINETISNQFRYVGRYGVMEGENELHFMRARFYKSNLGRFLVIDPEGFVNGVNLYSYVSNNPITYVDPTGKDLWDVWGWLEPFKRGWDTYRAANPQKIGPAYERCLSHGDCTGIGEIPKDWLCSLMGPFCDLKDPNDYNGGDKPSTSPKIPSCTDGNLPCQEEDSDSSQEVAGFDPNDKTGPTGYAYMAFVPSSVSLPYTINFENVPDAAAPAQWVTITDQLSPALDWRTLQLGEIAFGDKVIQVPDNRPYYYGEVILENGLLVRIDAGLNLQSGVVTWTFTTIDPTTGEVPENPLQGFLPPNEPNTHSGEGHVTYFIRPVPNIATGTEITNSATIIFDNNDPIVTNEVFHTLDVGLPNSAVAALPGLTIRKDFPVNWSGQDDASGSGVAGFDVYASDNGGPYALWLSNVTDTSWTFAGDVGHNYRFYSVARDHVGNLETTPLQPDAGTTVIDITLSNPNPPDGAIGVPIHTGFSWNSGYAADAYDIYIWRTGDPKPGTPLASGLTENAYTPVTPLLYGTAYKWQVVAKVGSGEAEGPVWTLMTRTDYEEWIGRYPGIPADRRGLNDDPDGDGLTNQQEFTAGTDPMNSDTDGDGMPDGWEVTHLHNPLANDAELDADGDGYSNLEEYQGGSDPQDSDNVPPPQCDHPRHWNEPEGSDIQMRVAGFNFIINSRVARPCDEVAVFDSGDQRVGTFVVHREGEYGKLIVFGDLPETTDIDEGAPAGDRLKVRVWDSLDQIEYAEPRVLLRIPGTEIPPYILYQPPLTFKADQAILMDIDVSGVDLSLTTGWNLFGWISDGGYYEGTEPQESGYASVGILIPENGLADALATVGISPSSYLAVIGPDGKVYTPGSPEFNTLRGLLPGQAYWIYMKEDTTVTTPGRLLLPASSLTLPAGWVQVAYWGEDGKSPASAFRCFDSLYDVISDGLGRVYIPGSPFNTLITIHKAEGYYIHMTKEGVLKYDCP